MPINLPKNDNPQNKNVSATPQIDASRFFVNTDTGPLNVTEVDWQEHITELSSSENQNVLIISSETLGPAYQRLNYKIFRELPENTKAISIVYLRHPINLYNSWILQTIMGSLVAIDSFEKQVINPMVAYFRFGFRPMIEAFSTVSEVKIRSYDSAKLNLIEDFCTTLGVPFIQDVRSQNNVNARPYGRNTGLLVWALRATQPQTSSLDDVFRLKQVLSRQFRQEDKSDKSFIPEPYFSHIVDRWKEDRVWLKEVHNVDLKENTEQTAQDSILRLSKSFAEALMKFGSDFLSAEDFKWLKAAVDLAISGLSLPSIIERNWGVKTFDSNAGSGQTDILDQQIVFNVARAIWMSEKRISCPNITQSELSQSWQAEQNKPLNQARIFIRQLQARGVYLSEDIKEE